MTTDVLAKCSRENLVRFLRGYWDIMTAYEEVCGGPSKAAMYREYLIIRQNINQVRSLLNEMPED